MSIKPLQDWVVLEQDAPETLSIGGLIIPDSAQKKQEQGKVISVGEGKYVEEKTGTKYRKNANKAEKKFVKTTLKPGDHVLYEKWSSKEIEIDGVDYVLVREEDVLGVMED